MFLLPSNFLSEFVWQQFARLPFPEGDFTEQIVIVTGANCGLGLEVARHFVRLKASKVILGCRSIPKGEAAKADIEKTTATKGVVEVWHVDLSSFNSIKTFCARAQGLPRLDILIENAGIATGKFELFEGYESTITVNVISTFLMALSLLPKLRETATKFATTPHLVIVTSDAHQMANFRERSDTDIFAALSDPASIYQADRYNTSKLLEILVVREFAPAIKASSKSGKPFVIVNTVNPGYCISELQRNATPVLYFFIKLGGLFLARTTEVGSRTLFSGAVAGEESHGMYMNVCKVVEPSAFVRSPEGLKTQKEVYRQIMGVLESIQSEITKEI